MTSDTITFHVLGGEEALAHLDELRGLYAEVYAEPPYGWDDEHADLFAERFTVQARQDGFALVEARHGGELVGCCFGVTLLPSTPWWSGLLDPVPADVTDERPGRTFAVVELLVRKPWRRQHIARTMHDLLLHGRPEERATLTVLPAAIPAQTAYAKWGWRKVAQKRNPLPGSPVFDVLVKERDWGPATAGSGE
ncbi:MAG TPA: GNAT family N-acetyltransferase [Actinobacteria bacterium]|nr:GNAT family N-acetyltransferase [Actinomycetota bacterium]